MSLIPSESFSFPDDFSRSVSRARVLEERQRYARKTEKKAPPEPKKEVAAPVEAERAEVKTVKRAVIARVPRFGKSAAPKVAIPGNARPPGAKKVAAVRLAKSVRVPPNVVVDLPKEAAVWSAPIAQTKEEELVVAASAIPRRRSRKLQRFLKIEIPAVIVMIASATVGFLHPFPNPIAGIIVNAVTIGAAFVATITPIAFFALSPTLPPTER